MAQSVDFVLNLKANVEEAMRGVKAVQNGLGQLKLPKGFESSFEKSFGNLEVLVKKFNDQLNKGVKTRGDVTGLERITNQIDIEMDKISKDLQKLTGQEIHFKVNTTEIDNAKKKLDEAVAARNKFAASQADVKIGKSGKSANELLDAIGGIAGKTKTGQAARAAKDALNAGDLQGYIANLAIIEKYYSRIKESESRLGDKTGLSSVQAFEMLRNVISGSSSEMEAFNKRVAGAEDVLKTAVANGARDAAAQVQNLNDKFEKEKQVIEDAERAQEQLASQSQNLNQNIGQLESHVAMYFSFAAILRKVTQIAQKAFQTVKELDAAMVETAVVTNFDVGDMWDMLPTYTENANALGSTIKDVYDAATLYYQQGLNQAQAMSLANETLKMARIGGLEAAEATDMMTAALRGFNMQINEMSAERINDVYSKLAAITASDTREIGSAMERTASIANSANMDFETTSAFLAQMIETTREAPENLGTAMKTIVARFQEMKQDPTKLIDSEGEMLNANKVDAALKTIGVSLMDTNGQFRDLDDVFLEISSKWGGLTQSQQRYIATIAAGSRQQSRFIAMMQNYDRTMELVEAANNSTGASQEQFDKTLEGLDAKLNKLKNAWDQFTMGLANNKIIKLAVDGMTDLFTVINKILGVLDNIPDPFGGLTKSLVTLLTVIKGMNLGGKILTGGVKGIGDFASGKAVTPISGIKKGIHNQFEQSRTARNNAAATREANRDTQIYKSVVTKNLSGFSFAEAMSQAKAASASTTKSLINGMFPPKAINNTIRNEMSQIVIGFQQAFQQGLVTEGEAIEQLRAKLKALGVEATDAQLKTLINTTEKGAQSFTGFGAKVTSAGNFLTQFGFILQQTGGPLAVVGQVLTTAGFALATLGTSLTTLSKKTAIATAMAFMHAAGMEAEEIQAKKTAIANGEASAGETIKGIISGAGGATKAIGLIGKALLRLLGPIAAISAAVFIIYKIYRIATQAKRELQEAGQAAGAAADAYSSAAQATSELRDNLSKLEEAQAGFDGLVEGTAAFNEQLIKSNELVVELLKKYPMLYDYLKTEDNGRMTISDEGMEAVLDYQQKITSQAAALSTITNGEYRAKQSEQEEKDLIKERNEALRTFDGTLEEREKLIKTYDKEFELLDKQQDTYRQSSKVTALTTALSEKELNNQEAITQLYSDQYDLRKGNVDLTKEESYQKYADFYGYDYRGGKLYDSDNNEVDVEKSDVISAAEEIEVLTTFETDAESLNSVINFANDYFKENFNWDPFGNVQGKDTFISDLLGKNVEASEDAIQEILNDNSILEDLADEMSAEQIAQILGVSLDTVETDLETYREKVVDLFEEDANLIAEAQAQDFADLGILIGRTYDTKNVKFIENQLKQLNQNQRQTMLTAAQAIEKSAGAESMETLVRGMNEIYKTGTSEEISQMEDWVNGINWDSAIERLGAYKELTESEIELFKDWGNEFNNLSDSSNLMTDALEEVYDSSDFMKAMEDVSKYTDSLGHFDASGITDLSKDVGTLNSLLKTGAVSTGGLARMMNLLQDNADLTLLDINDNLLKLLNNLGQFDTLLGDAHNTIENFDPGLDTGEAGDFFVDAVEKYNEFFENGEWGNPQMRAYAEFIVGEDNFIAQLKENNGDLKETYEDFNGIINEFATGGYDLWERVANTTGGAADRFSFDENGNFQIDLTGITSIEDVVNDLAEAGKISKEGAQVALELFSNYSPDFQSQMEAVAAYNTFNEDGRGYLKNKVNSEGQIVLLQSDLEKFALALGLDTSNEDELKELKETIASTVGKKPEDVETIDNVSETSTPEKVAEEYSKAFMGEAAETNDWIKQYQQSNTIDAQKALSGLKEFDFTESEAMTMLWNAFKDSDKDFKYNGITLNRDEINTQEDFEEQFAKAVEAPDWVEVGELIAQGFYEHNKKIKEEEATKEEEEKKAGNSSNSKDTSSDVDYSDYKTNKSKMDAARSRWSSRSHALGPSAERSEEIKNAIFSTDELDEARKEVYGDKNNSIKIPAEIDTKELETTLQKDTGELTAQSKNKPVQIDAKVAVDSSQVAKEKNEINNGEPATISAKVELTGEDFQSRLEESGLVTDAERTITIMGEEDGSFKQISVDIDDIPKDVSITSYLKDEFTDPTNAVIRSYDGAYVTIEDLMEDNFTDPTNQAITAFEGAYVNIPVNMELTEAAKSLIQTFSNRSVGGLGRLSGIKTGQGLFNLSGANAVIHRGGHWGDVLNTGSYKVGATTKGGNNSSKSSIPRNVGGSGGGSGGSGGGGGGGNGSDKHQTINNWSIEEVIRFDAEKKIDNYQHKVDMWMKDLDKRLDKIGTKVGDVTSNINNQVSYLKSVKNQNDNLAKSYQRSLNKLDTGNYKETISYDKNGESQQEDVNLSPYIYKDKWGNYQIDQNKIAKAGSKQRQEAIFKAIQSALDPLVSGLQNAQKAAREAQDAIDELGKKVFDTFWGWENEITEVYNLTQRIANDDSKRNRFTSQVSLELARLNAGFSNTASAVRNSTMTLSRYNKTTLDQITASNNMIAARKRELNAAFSTADELQLYNAVKNKFGASSAEAEEAKKGYDAAAAMQKYVKDFSINVDGSIDYNIDWAKFEQDRLAGNITQETYDAIKKGLDKLNDAAVEYNNSINDTTELLTSLYDALLEYQKTIADFEDALIQQLEKDLQDQIDNSKKLNDSIKNALKDLLNQIKRKLDERRQKEDNAKTEQDIANKQQRLALLKASTNGSQVEIAQLEKEIAESQQSYQRSLEDQLLDRLQQQGDEAAAQRERLIEIAQAQLDLSKTDNRAEVAKWLSNPELYKDQIKEAWLAANNYEDKGEHGRQVLEQEFEKSFAELVNALKQTSIDLTDNTITTAELARTVENSNALSNVTKKNTVEGNASVKEYKQMGASVADAMRASKEAGKPLTAKELKDAGYTAKELYDSKQGFYYPQLKEAGYSLKDIKAVGYGAKYLREHGEKAEDLKAAGFTAKEMYNAGYGYPSLKKLGYTLAQIKSAGYGASYLKNHGEKLADLKKAGFTAQELIRAGFKAADVNRLFGIKTSIPTNNQTTVSDTILKKVASAIVNASNYGGWGTGSTRKSRLTSVFGPNNANKVQKFINNGNYPSLSSGYTYNEQKKKSYKKYKTGGLADYTGPAWLDGTKSKPELVLNATDTKNFIQLKDILASTMRAGAFNTPVAVSGDTNYEININVDHINNDYDVDKIANRVKKIIVQDSSYRNVTSVRKFR